MMSINKMVWPCGGGRQAAVEDENIMPSDLIEVR